MTTTLNFDDRLIHAAKTRAAQDGKTLTRLIALLRVVREVATRVEHLMES